MSGRSYIHYLQRIYHQQEVAPGVILHYDTASQDLRVWLWYVIDIVCHRGRCFNFYCLRPVSRDGSRVTPADLAAHRIAHEFLAPCCLCASKPIMGIGYIETVIYRLTHGVHFGDYVAACAFDRCGYFGGS
jgi:hypothetical protein